MLLADWLARIEQAHPQEIELGLERVAVVAGRLELAPGPARVITVAGTNGKGSCVATSEQLLSAAGYRVGCYTSPHLRRYNERVRIDGEEVSDAELVAAFEQVDRARGEVPLTYFEYGTLAALWLLQQSSLDAWVLEVGLGGRLDAVNIVDPDVAVITSIDIDHIDWLGDDRNGIAAEKAGIFRADRPAVCTERDPPPAIADVAKNLGTRLLSIGADCDVQGGEAARQWRWVDAHGALQVLETASPVQLIPENMLAAIQAVALLDMLPATDDLEAALAACRGEGRMQRRLINGREYLLDVAHNPAGTARLAAEVAAMPSRPTALVFAAMQDKDIATMTGPLAGLSQRWWLPALSLPRAAQPAAIAPVIEAGNDASVSLSSTVAEALADAAAAVGDGGRVIVCGSFFTVGPALDFLDQLEGADG